MNLSFHQTFPPERDCLARLLEIASDMPPMTKEQISQVTGIPTGTSSGKVEPHIQYAEFMGLICDLRSQGLHCLTRTALGEQIYLSDPFLSEPLSQLLCHANICREYVGADLWHYIFSKAARHLGHVIPNKQLELALSREFGVNRVNVSPLRTCYTNQKCLGTLSLISINGSGNWCFHPHGYRSECRYAYAYYLVDLWDQKSPETPEVTLDMIVDSWHWASPYLWDTATALDVLDRLAGLGLISLNRQLSPITVVRRADKSTVLACLYRLLI